MNSVEVAGRTVRLPVGVRDALAASATFVVPAAPADLWLPEGLSLVPAGPGRAVLMLTATHYRDNDLGRYDELSVALVVRHGLRVGIYVHRLPVDDEFSRAAGGGIWGFPKTVEDLTVERTDDGVASRWTGEDGLVIGFSVRGAGEGVMPAQAYRAFSVIEGRLHTTRFILRASGFAVRRGGADVELGAGDAADELRRLGLPKTALFSTTMERMQARFDAPRPV